MINLAHYLVGEIVRQCSAHEQPAPQWVDGKPMASACDAATLLVDLPTAQGTVTSAQWRTHDPALENAVFCT